MCFLVDEKGESLEFEPLMEKPLDPNKQFKVKEKQAFKVRQQVFLNYPVIGACQKCFKSEFYPFEVVKDLLGGLVEIYNVEQGYFKLDPQYLKSGGGNISFSRWLMDPG